MNVYYYLEMTHRVWSVEYLCVEMPCADADSDNVADVGLAARRTH